MIHSEPDPEPARLLEGIRDWLSERGVTSVELAPAAWQDSGVADHAHVHACFELRLDVRYGQEARLQQLMLGFCRRFAWCDLVELDLVPVRARGAHVARLLVVWLDPQSSLSEEGLRTLARLDDAEECTSDYAERLHSLADAWASSSHVSKPEQFWSDFGQWCSGASVDSERDEEERRFLRLLPTGLRACAEDARLLSFLDQSRRRLIERIDEWAQEETAASGRPVGLSLRRAPWQPRLPGGSSPVREVGLVEPDGGRAAPELYRIATDPRESPLARRMARRELLHSSPEAAGPWLVRLVGHPQDRWRVLTELCRHPPLQPLLRALVLREEAAGTGAVLDALITFGAGLDDPLDALRCLPDAGVPGPLDDRLQTHLASNLPQGGAENVSALADALRAAARAPGTRSLDWLRSVLLHIGMAHESLLPRVADSVAPFVTHADKLAREFALCFFRRVDHPPVWNQLRAATFDADPEIVISACDGLAGQSGLESRALLDALNIAVQLGEQQANKGQVRFATAGRSLLQTLAQRGPCADEELVRRALRRMPDEALTPELRSFAGWLGPEEQLLGAAQALSPQVEFRRALDRWVAPGAVLGEYQRRGERHESWDEAIEAGHRAYDMTDFASARLAFERALAAGCQDGMLLYRLGYVASSEDRPLAESYLRRAWSPMQRHYPDTPYLVAAAEAIGGMRLDAGDIEEALYWLRASRLPRMESPSALAKLEVAERAERALAEPARAPAESGQLGSIGSCWHAEQVSGLALHGAGASVWLASATVAGVVQLSELVREPSFASVEPLYRLGAHAPGRTRLTWVGERLLSSGADGRVLSIERERHGLVARCLAELPAAVRACASWRGNSLACACEDGSLWRLALDGTLVAIERDSSARIVELVSDGEALLAVDEETRVEVWGARARSQWQCLGARTALFTEDGPVLIARALQDGFELRERQAGGVIGAASWSGEEPDFLLSSGAGGALVSAWRGGVIQTSETRVLTDSIECLVASAELGLVAHASARHRLRVARI